MHLGSSGVVLACLVECEWDAVGPQVLGRASGDAVQRSLGTAAARHNGDTR